MHNNRFFFLGHVISWLLLLGSQCQENHNHPMWRSSNTIVEQRRCYKAIKAGDISQLEVFARAGYDFRAQIRYEHANGQHYTMPPILLVFDLRGPLG